MAATPISVDQVLQALNVLFVDTTTSPETRKQANAWLETFQKTSVAWQIADNIIRRTDLPISARIFAAQTFRQKIEFDLDQLDEASVTSLRDSLLDLLCANKSESKGMRTQLCLSLADLAILMPSWKDPVPYTIELFGADHLMSGILLQFLSVLPEEISHNSKLYVDKSEVVLAAKQILQNNAQRVFELLLNVYEVSETLVDSDDNRYMALSCLVSWLKSGNVSSDVILGTKAISVVFRGLASDDLFDVAADAACEIIYRAASKPRDVRLFEAVYPHLLPLFGILQRSSDNDDLVRGICRIFVEAGEGFPDLLATNPAGFQAIIEGLVHCTSYEDLEISKITFNFWHTLTDTIAMPEFAAAKPQFFPVYRQILDIMLKHLRYPKDLTSWTAQERDEFRDFRHIMGDVLKDCARILGDEESLSRPYSILQSFFQPHLGTGASANGSDTQRDVAWPEFEAPLFALRAMCREVSVTESKYLPEIMAMLPKLPSHPKIKYAAILLIGRYAEWTNEHPQMLSYQLDYVSKGFDEDSETIAAASQTFRDLCKYCSKHLVNLLPQVHPFYERTLNSVHHDDRRQLTEAIAHIINAVPMEDLGQALQLYVLPVAQRLHAFASTAGEPDVPQVKIAVLSINELAYLFRFVMPSVANGTPHPCILLLTELWPVIEKLYERFAGTATISEALARLFRNVLDSYKFHFLPLLPRLIHIQAQAFERTGLSCYVWIASRCVRVFGSEDNEVGPMVADFVLKMTELVFHLVQQKAANLADIDEVIEDYHTMMSEFIDSCPYLYLSSPILTSTLDCAMFCLAADSTVLPFSLFRFFQDVFALAIPSRRDIPYSRSSPLVGLIDSHGPAFALALLKGLVFTFPRDREVVQDVADLVLTEVTILGVEKVMTHIQGAVQTSFSDDGLPAELRDRFLLKLGQACTEGSKTRLASVLQDFAAGYARRNLINARK